MRYSGWPNRRISPFALPSSPAHPAHDGADAQYCAGRAVLAVLPIGIVIISDNDNHLQTRNAIPWLHRHRTQFNDIQQI